VTAGFDVSVNKLEGTLPPTFQFPSSLETLYLNNNTFTGSIPAWELPGDATDPSTAVVWP